MAKNVVHFKKDCISCGACAAINPDHWEMDSEGLAQLKGSSLVGEKWELPISDSEIEANQEASEVCPVNIIHVKDKEED